MGMLGVVKVQSGKPVGFGQGRGGESSVGGGWRGCWGGKWEAVDLTRGATQPDFCLTEPFCQLCTEQTRDWETFSVKSQMVTILGL